MIRLIKHEFLKLYKNTRLIVLALVVLLFAAGYLQYAIAHDDHQGYTAIQEKELFCDMEDLSDQDRLAYLQTERENIEEELSQALSGEISEEELLQYRQLLAFYQQETEAIKNCAEYEGKRAELANPQEGLLRTSLGQEDAYLKKYQDKVAGMYANVRAKELSLQPSAGMSLLADVSPVDLCLILLLAAFVFQIIHLEYREKTENLIRYTNRGFHGVFWAKICTANLAAVFLSSVFYVMRLLIVFGNLGSPAWNAPVQSMQDYFYCPYNLSIGALMLLVWIGKTGACLLLANFFFVVSAVFRNIVSVSVVEVLILVSQFYLWDSIGYGMWNAAFKEMNAAAVLASGHYFAQPVVVNVLGIPTEGWVLGLVTALAVPAFLIAGTKILWGRELFLRMGNLYTGVSGHLKKNFHRKKRMGLRHFERKNLWLICRGTLVLFLMLGLQYLVNREYGIASDQELYYRNYCDSISKMNGEEIKKFLEDEEALFEEQREFVRKLEKRCAQGEISQNAFESLSRQYEIPESRLSAFEELRGQFDTVKERHSEGTTFYLFYETGWKKIFGEDGWKGIWRDTGIFLAGAILCVYQFETMDILFHTEELMRTKACGGKKRRRIKTLCSMQWAVITMAGMLFVRLIAVQLDFSWVNIHIVFASLRDLAFLNTRVGGVSLAMAIAAIGFFQISCAVFGVKIISGVVRRII